jgi:hypothetical protein
MDPVKYFNQKFCSGSVQIIQRKPEQFVTITGKLKDVYIPPNTYIYYWAANPAHKNRSSKSALPYANPEQAFDRSPNIGRTQASGYDFSITIEYPSAYYVGLGSVLIDPSIHIKIANRDDFFDTIQLGEGYPYRTLTYPSDRTQNARENPMFYHQEKLPIRGQEAILRASAYPSHFKSAPNFWGMRPAR